MIGQFTDKDLGLVVIVRNIRAKRLIARRKADYVQVTVPPDLPDKEIFRLFEQIKPKLLALEVKPAIIFDENTSFRTMSFLLKIENRNVQNFYVSLKDGILTIVCPNISDFAALTVQNTIRNSIERVMRHEAKRIFPGKIEFLAQEYGFTYSGLSINKSRSRWGSCSSKKSINLSYFCMLLPEYLIDFVILHELCHTIEMNHSPKFWKLLDDITGGKAKKFTSELKTAAQTW